MVFFMFQLSGVEFSAIVLTKNDVYEVRLIRVVCL